MSSKGSPCTRFCYFNSAPCPSFQRRVGRKCEALLQLLLRTQDPTAARERVGVGRGKKGMVFVSPEVVPSLCTIAAQAVGPGRCLKPWRGGKRLVTMSPGSQVLCATRAAEHPGSSQYVASSRLSSLSAPKSSPLSK